MESRHHSRMGRDLRSVLGSFLLQLIRTLLSSRALAFKDSEFFKVRRGGKNFASINQDFAFWTELSVSYSGLRSAFEG